MNERIIDIRRTVEGDRLSCAAAGFMGKALFDLYLGATRRADFPYDKNLNMQVGKPEDAGALIKALLAAGFWPRIDAAVQTRLADLIAELEGRANASNALAAASAAEFAARGLALYPFQETGATFLRERVGGALLADQMGLGKTIQALAALPAKGRAIVSCPAAVKGVWKFEIGRWRPDFKITVLKGRGTFRVPAESEIIILNPELLPDEVPADLPEGLVLIVDEAHMFKGRTTARTRRLRELGAAVKKLGGRIWLLTGTPLLNRPSELWNVLENADLAREAFGSYKRFSGLFDAAHGGGSDELARCLRKVALMRRRDEVLPDLPGKTYAQVTFDDYDTKTKAALDRLQTILEECGYFDRVQVGIEEVAGAERAFDVDAQEDEGRGRKGRIPFEEIARIRALVASAKIPTMAAVIEEYEAAEEPLVVFSAHKAPVEVAGKRPGWALITGDTKPEDRTKIVADFQAGRLKGVALTIRAGGVGLTLTYGCTVLFVDEEWTPALNSQAEDRTCRIGQNRPVVVKSIVAAHPIDERLHELLHLKAGYVSTVETAAVDAGTDTAKLLLKKAADLTEIMSTVEVASAPGRAAPSAPPTAPDEKRVTLRIDDREFTTVARGARTDEERWAASAVQTLAACDTDRARELNGVGFNKLDGRFGHALADQLAFHEALTENQWKAAIKMAYRYPKQVGRPTVATPSAS